MPTLTAGKIAEVLFENALETYELETSLLDKTQVFRPDPATMQNAGDVIWRPVEQHAPIIEGWDMTGQEQEIIEETYPATLGLPKNDMPQLRIDQLRDKSFWENRGKASGRKQAIDLNKKIAEMIASSSSLFYRSNAASGFDFISEAQALMNEQQGKRTNRCFYLNDRATKDFSEDLAARQTIQGRPEQVWKSGQIAGNVAQFDVYTASFCPILTGGADPATTTTAAASFKPEAGTVDSTTYAVTNIDYREVVIAVVDSSGYSVGDKVTIANSGTTIKALGKADKTATDTAMTFTVVSKPNGTSLKLWPKPIAADDGALTETEKAYANVDTTITSGATVNRVNIDASKRTNLFFDEDAIEVLDGDVPLEMFKEFEGARHIKMPLSNGLTMHMLYSASSRTLNFDYRLFTRYGLCMKDPSRAGVAVQY